MSDEPKPETEPEAPTGLFRVFRTKWNGQKEYGKPAPLQSCKNSIAAASAIKDKAEYGIEPYTAPIPKIGVFGGTFDPIHTGHIAAATHAMETHKLDRVIFIPAKISPHKLKSTPTEFSHRVEMVKLAIANNPNFGYDAREGLRPGPSFAVDTISLLKQELNPAELYLMVGTDQVEALDKWHRIDDLRKMAKILHMDRPPNSLSASSIREDIQKEADLVGLLLRNAIHSSVAAYIQNHNLYS